jgi:hypothetical protein
MAEYKDIKGFKVQTVSTDPAASIIATGTWASGGNANTAREELGAGGTATAAIIFGGQGPPSDSPRTRGETEIFNGSSWTEVGDLNTVKKNQAGAGTTTSALSSSGQDPSNDNSPLVEQWNGSAWSEVAEVNTARRQLAGAGASGTAALIFFGFSGSYTNACESWNGSAWTEVGDTNTGRVRAGSFGSYTSAIGAGGGLPPDGSSSTANSESWNGTAWTETSNLNTSRKDMSSHGSGASNTDGLIMAGYTTTNVANTEFWDGSSWTELADLSTAFRNGFGSQQGSSSSAIAGIGFSSTYGVQTELWTTTPAPTFQQENLGQVFYNSTADAFKVTQQSVPAGTWASGGNLNTARRQQGSFGTYNDGVIVNTPAFGGNTEIYNGTAWTEVNDVPAGATSLGGSGNTSASGAVFFGYNTATSVTSATYEFDGTNWTAGSSANTARAAGGGTGSSANDAIYVGGVNAAAPQTYFTNVETYNGTAWTETTDISGNRQLQALVGTSTSALMIGGSPAPIPTQTQTWNGTAWTNIGALPTDIYGNAGFGTQGLAVAAGGLPPGPDTNANMRAAMFWNGTSWSDLAEMSISRASANGIATNGSATSGLVIGGYNPLNAPNYDLDANKTEEWNVPETNSTLTVS